MSYEDNVVPVTRDTITVDAGPYQSITGHFEAERYPGCDLLDTSVELKMPRVCITWNDRKRFLEELAEVLRKYQL